MNTSQPTWASLRAHATPQWFRDAKFGVYTHWGVYSVPACGTNGTWYPYHMYREGTKQHEFHVKTYGHPSQFGYKDLIPMFKGERFDADDWKRSSFSSPGGCASTTSPTDNGYAGWPKQAASAER